MSAADQPAEELGTTLMLPPWLEPQRPGLERVLPPLRLPAWHGGAGGPTRSDEE